MSKQKVSKEYIEAMNGVMNGEKWRRDFWGSYVYIKKRKKIPFLPDVIITHMRKSGGKDRYYDISIYDMQATDWSKF